MKTLEPPPLQAPVSSTAPASPASDRSGSRPGLLRRILGDPSTPRPYLVAGGICFALAACLFAGSLSAPATFWLSRVGIDPFLTAEELAAMVAAALALAASPGLRGALAAGIRYAAAWLAPRGKQARDATKDGSPNETTWALLGGLRFYLALVVVCTHQGHWTGYHWASWLYPVVNMNASCAVIIFLVISGFSMAHSLAEKPRGFYLRRIKRLWPVYLSCLALSLLPFCFGIYLHTAYWHVSRPYWWTVVFTALFLQGWLTPGVSSAGQYWSLGVEAACYAVAPILRRVSIWLIAGVIVISSWRFVTGPWFYPYVPHFGGTTLYCIWAWLIGWLYYQHRQTWLRLVPLGIMFVILDLTHEWNNSGFMWLPALLASALTVGPLIQIEWCRRALEWLGDLSYPLYCCQNAAFWLLWETTHRASPILYIAGAVVLGVAVLYIVDYPTRRLLRRPLVAAPAHLVPSHGSLVGAGKGGAVKNNI